jgi:hypothetical protein
VPGLGRRYQFIGKTPPIFAVVAVVFAANIILSLTLAFLGKYLVPRGMPNSHPCPAIAGYGIQHDIPASICWYATRSDTISLILGVLLAVIVFAFRKNIHRVR